MKVHIITKNPGKQIAARSIFAKYNIEAVFIENDYPEIQADSSLEIARFTALKASKELNIPVIREDHSLFLNAFGCPGPYISYIEKKISNSKLLEIMSSQSDRTGYFEVAAVFASPDGKYEEYAFKIPIRIALEEKGDLQAGWNRLIQFEGDNRTLAEYPEEERSDIWNQNFKIIAENMIKY